MLDDTHFGFTSVPSDGAVKYCAAYVIVHLDGVYIGSSGNIRKRQYWHRATLKAKDHWCTGLQAAYNVNPFITFKAFLTNNREEAFEREGELLKWYRSNGFSVFNNGGDDPRLPRKGVEISEENREKLRLWIRTEETRRKIGDKHLGKIVSKETREKRSAANDYRKVKVSIHGIIYFGYSEAARHLNMNAGHVRHRVMSQNPRFADWLLVDQ